jgi:two-component system, cell cycle response regulator
MVVDQVKSICEGTTWEVVHVTKDSEAIAYIANRLPDVILASLSLPGEQGFGLFNTLKSDDRTRRIPYFGLSVKTALEEQTRAQQDGITGIFTKPLDINDMRQRLTRALNVDVSEKYFGVKENILHVTFPPQMDAILSEIAPNITTKIAEMVDGGMGKALFDLTQVANMDTNIIRVLIQAIELCDQLGVTYAVVGSTALATKAQAFEETKSITIFEDADQALKTLT